MTGTGNLIIYWPGRHNLGPGRQFQQIYLPRKSPGCISLGQDVLVNVIILSFPIFCNCFAVLLFLFFFNKEKFVGFFVLQNEFFFIADYRSADIIVINILKMLLSFQDFVLFGVGFTFFYCYELSQLVLFIMYVFFGFVHNIVSQAF